MMVSLTKMALMHCDDENDKNYLSNLSLTKKGWGLDTNKGYLSQYLLTPASNTNPFSPTSSIHQYHP